MEKLYEKIAKHNGWVVNTEMAPMIEEGLLRNKELHGKMYCPCLVNKSQETICPCKEWRENTDMKQCHCGLYERDITE